MNELNLHSLHILFLSPVLIVLVCIIFPFILFHRLLIMCLLGPSSSTTTLLLFILILLLTLLFSTYPTTPPCPFFIFFHPFFLLLLIPLVLSSPARSSFSSYSSSSYFFPYFLQAFYLPFCCACVPSIPPSNSLLPTLSVYSSVSLSPPLSLVEHLMHALYIVY